MNLIDTHGHLNFEAFNETWADVADQSLARGLQAIIMPGAQLPTSQRSIELARQRPDQLFAAIGLHPTHVSPEPGLRTTNYELWNQAKYEDFNYNSYRHLAEQPEVVAIGEVGLDTYRVPNDQFPMTNSSATLIDGLLQEQERVLGGFMQIAQLVHKPMILHCRGKKKPESSNQSQESDKLIDPHERLLSILAAVPNKERPRFVIHCYQGTADQAARYLDLGGLISFTGTITYSTAPEVTDVVRSVPLDRLMVETDSPYLSPVPYRGEPNEPWKVLEVARQIALIHSRTLESVAEQTTANAMSFFGLSGGKR